MALSAGKLMTSRDGRQGSWPMAASVTIYQGSMVMLNAGLAQVAGALDTAAHASQCVVVGISEATITNDATAGDNPVPTIGGLPWLMKNSPAGADLISLANVGSPAYAVDDETVALTSNTNVRPKAGTITDVTSDGVWVRVGV